MTPKRGNPYLQVRLPQEGHDRLKEFVDEGEGGKAGGVSLFVRRLIYRELNEPMPKQWGRENTMADLFELRDQVRRYQADGLPQGKELFSILGDLLDRQEAEQDPVRRTFVHQIAGEFTLALLEAGILRAAEEER